MTISLENKIRFGFAISLIILITISFVSYHSITDISENITSVKRIQQVQTNLAVLLSGLTDAEADQRGFVITGDKSFLVPYIESTSKCSQSLAQLKELIIDPGQSERLKVLDTLMLKRLELINQVIATYNTGGHQAAENEITNGQGRHIHDKICTLMNEMVHTENDLLKEQDQKSQKNIRFTKTVIISGSLLALLLVCGAVFITYIGFSGLRQAEKDINQLNETLEERVVERTDQLLAINKKLEFHIKEIEQFTFIASHDLQEPLLTLTNFTELIQNNLALKMEDEEKMYIRFIYDSAFRMRTLVKGLLDYSLLGKDNVHSAVSCQAIVHEVIEDLNNSILQNKAVITLGELPWINGDRSELKLLFHNLLANAIKFKKHDTPPVITISSERIASEVIISVKDNGIGFESKNTDKIFTIFKQLHNRNEYEGTGIGLALCKKIVDLHGGRIWAESSPGEGSIFNFTIPNGEKKA